MAENKGASIIESVLSVIGKTLAVGTYIVTRFLETLLSGINAYLKKLIDRK